MYSKPLPLCLFKLPDYYRSSTEQPERDGLMQGAPSSPTPSPKRFLQPPTSAPLSTASKSDQKSRKLRSPRPYSPVYSNINYDHVTDRWENFLFLSRVFFFRLFQHLVICFKSRATFSCNQEKWNKPIVWIHCTRFPRFVRTACIFFAFSSWLTFWLSLTIGNKPHSLTLVFTYLVSWAYLECYSSNKHKRGVETALEV